MHVVDLLFGMAGRGRKPSSAPSTHGRMPTMTVSLASVSPTGSTYPGDARFDLVVDGDRAGYALSPDEVKRQVSERLDIEMRRVGCHGPEPRRSLAETADLIERLHGRSPTGADHAVAIPTPAEGRKEDHPTC